MNCDFTFFPLSVVFSLHPFFKDGDISKYLSLYYKILMGNIIHLYGFNYFLMRMMPKMHISTPFFPLFTWILHENLKSKGSKLNSFFFLFKSTCLPLLSISPLRTSIYSGKKPGSYLWALPPLCSISMPSQPWSPKYFVNPCIFPLTKTLIIFMRIIAELSHWSLFAVV